MKELIKKMDKPSKTREERRLRLYYLRGGLLLAGCILMCPITEAVVIALLG